MHVFVHVSYTCVCTRVIQSSSVRGSELSDLSSPKKLRVNGQVDFNISLS